MYIDKVEINDKEYSIKFDYNALADLEIQAGMGIGKLFVDEANIGFNTIRLVVWAGLKYYERGITMARVGAMLEEYLENGGDITELLNKFTTALQACSIFKTFIKNSVAEKPVTPMQTNVLSAKE